MNNFRKITIRDENLNCYNIKPFYYKELLKSNLGNGRYISKEMQVNAENRLSRLKSTNKNVIECCDPNAIIENPSQHALYGNFIIKYPYYRLVKNNDNNIVKIELSNVKNDNNWQNMNPYIYCKVSNSYKNNSIKSTSDPKIFEVNEFLTDCPTEYCSDSKYTVDDLLTGQYIELDNNYSHVDDTKIYFAIQNKDFDGLLDYIKRYNDVNRIILYNGKKYRLLHLSIIFYSPKMLKAILSMNPNLDATDDKGNTALHIAVMHHKFEALELLIENKPSLNLKNSSGYTPLMLALIMKTNDKIFTNYAYMEKLHKSGADIFDMDKNGNTLLHLAIIKNIDNIINCVNYLIDNGIELNSANNLGLTPLQLINEKINNNSNINSYYNRKEEEGNISEILNMKELELLTVQTLIFNNIIKQNPEKYNKFISLEELDDTVPIITKINKKKNKKYKCYANLNSINDNNNITGLETEDECKLKGGDYKLEAQDNVKVKFELLNLDELKDEELYHSELIERKKYPISNIDLAIEEINNNARKNIIKTTTENDYAGEYISRDIIITGNNSSNNNNINNNNINDENLDNENFMNIKSNKFSLQNIKEGFNNSELSIKYNNKHKYLIFVLLFLLIAILILVVYNFTH